MTGGVVCDDVPKIRGVFLRWNGVEWSGVVWCLVA